MQLQQKRILSLAKIYLLILLILFLTPAANAETEVQSLLTSVLNRAIPKVLQNLSDDLPEWAKRTDFTLHFQEDLKPLWSFETVQPLYRSSETQRHTIYFDDRFAHTAVDDTLNVGLGYRFLLPNEEWLLGANSFWDYTFDRRHARIGLGAEALCQFASLHFNYYEAYSGHRFFLEDGTSVQEKALDGWDIEGDVQIPYMPWAYATIKGFGWEGVSTKDVEGYTLSFLMNITRTIVLEFGRTDDDIGENNFLNVRFSLGGPERVEYTMVEHLFTKRFFSERDLKKQTLRKVRREQNIVVERIRLNEASGVTGGGVFIGRGT